MAFTVREPCSNDQSDSITGAGYCPGDSDTIKSAGYYRNFAQQQYCIADRLSEGDRARSHRGAVARELISVKRQSALDQTILA
jgi:hypothetical protein